MANEPRVYRESIAQIFRQLRPNVEVMTVEPDELDDCVRRLAPEMVIFSEATAERSTIEDIRLSDLLSIVDRIEQLPR